MQRFSIRVFTNVIIPVLFFIIPRPRSKHYESDKSIIVSFTSFPKRIPKVWLVIECMLRQSILPDKIMLYLSKQQFPNEYQDLPKKLVRLHTQNKIEIIFVEDDLKSHKKYFYAFQDFPNDFVILIDDDLFYVNTLIEDLVKLHHQFPEAICCHRARRVEKTSTAVNAYSKWLRVSNFHAPEKDLFHTTGGGTLYLPSKIDKEVFNKAVFKEICFFADDIWLNFHAQQSKIYTAKSSYYSDYLPIYNIKNISLKNYNVNLNGNDTQLQNLIDYYKVNPEAIF